MTELAYMIREDWAQEATAMVPQSAVIRDWLGDPPYTFATCDAKRIQESNSADMEFVEYVALETRLRRIVGTSELRKLTSQSKRFEGTLVVLHPHEQDDFELLRELVEEDLIARLFVIVWSPLNMIRFGLRAWAHGT